MFPILRLIQDEGDRSSICVPTGYVLQYYNVGRSSIYRKSFRFVIYIIAVPGCKRGRQGTGTAQAAGSRRRRTRCSSVCSGMLRNPYCTRVVAGAVQLK